MPHLLRSDAMSRATYRAVSHTIAGRLSRPRLLALVASLALAAPACAGRVVEVGTGGEVAGADATLVVTNSLAQAVNVYVRPAGGSEIFLRQIPGNVTETIPVRGLGVGTAVTLRAAPVDGRLSYSRENVVLARGVTWRVP